MHPVILTALAVAHHGHTCDDVCQQLHKSAADFKKAGWQGAVDVALIGALIVGLIRGGVRTRRAGPRSR